MTCEQRETHRKKRAIEYAEKIGNVRKACRYFGVARSTFYLWQTRYREFGNEALVSRRSVAHNHPNKTPAEVVEKILHQRRTYPMGPQRIVWYLERYHGIQTSDATVYRVCRRHGLRRLPHRAERARTSSTRSSPIEAPWISKRSWSSGSASTITIGHTEPTAVEHHTRR